MATPKFNYLFNFSSSYSGGGLIILKSYLKLFNDKGGATFILNHRLKEDLEGNFENNRFFFIKISKFKRLIDDEYYLKSIINKFPKFDLYFSYGIPVYSKIGKINWFHVSNLIPINPKSSHLEGLAMLKMILLRHRIKKFAKNIDFLSADSQDGVDQTIEFLGIKSFTEKVLKNGIDSKSWKNIKIYSKKEKVAVTVGTQKYKDLSRLYSLFLDLKKKGDVEKLKVYGDPSSVPKELHKDLSVEVCGFVPHSQILDELAKSKIYLSTSTIENSSIASLEGLYLCSESYLSTIGSHKELIIDSGLELKSESFEKVGSFYKVTGKISDEYISSISWDKINDEFFQYLEEKIIP